MTNIKRFREDKGLTQSELAGKLKIRQSTVAMWENGSNMPRTERLSEIAEIFGCTVDDLLKPKREAV